MKIHPNDEGLSRLVARVGTGRGRRVWRHLVTCDRCRQRLGDVLDWAATGSEPSTIPWSPKDYTALLDRLVENSETMGAPLSREQVEAPVLLAELLLHPTNRRRLLLRNSRRFRSWSLAELLLDRSREEAFEDPAQAESLARLGLEVASHLASTGHPSRLVADLKARGLAYLANALRMRSDLTAAEEAITQAKDVLETGTDDPFEEARILDLEASLRRDQHRFDAAFDLLGRAIYNYGSVGEYHRVVKARITQALVKRDSGKPEEAVALLDRVIAEMPPDVEPRTLLCAKHNLAFWSTDLERHMEARKIFRNAQDLYDRFPDPWTQRRRAWLEGRILYGLGQLDAAEERLVVAQRGFVEQEIAYDAGLVSLDLAAVYAAQGRTADLRRLAEEMLPVFRAQDIHREALAALSYFRWAVEMDRVTADLVHGLLTYLRSARHDPDRQFVRPLEE